MKPNSTHAALYGVAIGDALGVPVEFRSRIGLQNEPIHDFEGYKVHNQPAGTFSDDSSLTFCLAESLCLGYDLQDIASRFIKWRDEAYWTAGGIVFDIGITTDAAISCLRTGTRPALAGGFEEGCNGNGSLMRIMPLLFYIKDFDIEKRFSIIKDVSSITHGHIRSITSCFYYLELGREILNGAGKQTAYSNASATVLDFLTKARIDQREMDLFAPLLMEDISKLSIHAIPSSGYVLHTLKAAVYCFMTTNNYEEAALKAVNLGDDTDTTGAVTGGLAGLYYGFDAIPQKWIQEIKRSEDINDLCNRLSKALAV